jgi:hypothetical protein
MSSTISNKQIKKNNQKKKKNQTTTPAPAIEEETITTTSAAGTAIESEDEENQSTTTRDDESSLEENDEDQSENDEEEDTININKQSEAVNSKLLQSRPVMFSGDIKDFLLYKRHLLILLSGCNLLEELKPKEERNKKYKSTATARTRTITMINSTLPQKTADSFLELFEINGDYNLDINPVEYWKTICNRYEKNTQLNKSLVVQELSEEKMKGTEPIDDYTGRLTKHFQRLKSFGEVTNEETKKFHVLKGLPAEYKNYTQAMSLNSANMSYEDVVTHLTNFQANLRAEEKKIPAEEVQLVTRTRSRNDEQAAYVRSFGNGRGRGRGFSFRGRGRGAFNQQRREYNRPTYNRSYNQNNFNNYRPKELFSGRGSSRGRGSFRGRARMNYSSKNFMNRKPNSDANNNGNNINNNDNSNSSSSNESNNQQNNQRVSLACWKCGQPGHKSFDCRD